MKPLRDRIPAALAEIELAAGRADRDFQRYENMDTSRDMRRAHNLHMDGLRDGWRILNEIGVAADDIADLMRLRAEKPKVFDGFMLWVREELQRKDEPTEQVAA